MRHCFRSWNRFGSHCSSGDTISAETRSQQWHTFEDRFDVWFSIDYFAYWLFYSCFITFAYVSLAIHLKELLKFKQTCSQSVRSRLTFKPVGKLSKILAILTTTDTNEDPVNINKVYFRSVANWFLAENSNYGIVTKIVRYTLRLKGYPTNCSDNIRRWILDMSIINFQKSCAYSMSLITEYGKDQMSLLP